jgi:2-keto-4-pentenoate hydratase
MTMTGEQAARAAEMLLGAWRDPTHLVPALPTELRPANLAEAYAIQEAVSGQLGAIGGWKVGAAGPAAAPNCGPMPVSGIHFGHVRLPGARWPMRAVEAEICFRLATDLAFKDGPFTRQQVIAAIDSCHPGIEVLQSRFVDPNTLDPMTSLADSLGHGCYIVGPQISNWQSLNFAEESVRVVVNGREEVARVANPAGDMLRLVEWLANEGAGWAGGLRAGQIITTGSWTGKTVAPAGARVQAEFAHAGTVTLEFA